LTELEIEDRGNERVKTTVGTSKLGKEVLNQLKENGYFSSATNAFRFAVSFAIEKDLPLPESGRLSDTDGLTWGTTQLDPEGMLRRLIEQVYRNGEACSQKEAYVLAELLGESAVLVISERLKQGMTIGQLISE